MAYQNVGTPRFYIDLPNYLNSIGVNYTESVNSLFGLKNYNEPTFSSATDDFPVSLEFETENNINTFINPDNFYCAILNHNFLFKQSIFYQGVGVD